MKRYEEYEATELQALSDDQIVALIELEIAYAGIRPVFKMDPPSLEDVHITPTVTAYKVGERYFQNEDDAIEVARKTFFKLDYDYQGAGYDYKWLEPVLDTDVSKCIYYHKEDVMRVKEALTDNNRKREEFEKQNKEYNEFLKTTTAIRQEVWSTVNEARKVVAEIEHAKLIFQKHLGLAEGNEDIAKNFFRAAYKGRQDIIDAVLPQETAVEPIVDSESQPEAQGAIE